VLPAIENSLAVSKAIAFAVAKQAIVEGLSDSISAMDDDELIAKINQAFWDPEIDKLNS